MNPPSRDRAEVQELMVEIAVLKTRLTESEKAMSLQASEYARRLDELNHSHANMNNDRAKYVTRDLHDQLYQEMLRRVEDVGSRLQVQIKTILTAGWLSGVGLASLGVSLWHLWGK